MAILSTFRRKPKAELVELTEATYTSIPQGAIDREAGIIRGVKIIGRHSKRGHEYTEAALQEAMPKYEGSPVCIDHMPAGQGANVRSIRDTWGVLRNVEIRGDGAYGDLHYLKEHAETPAILERAEKGIPMGLSHNAQGKRARLHGREVVESITNVFSVDLVSRPATTTNLFESEERTVKTTLKELIEATGYQHASELIESLPSEVNATAEVELCEDDAADKLGAVKQVLATEAARLVESCCDGIGPKVEKLTAAVSHVTKGTKPEPEADQATPSEPIQESLIVETNKAIKELTESHRVIAKKLAAREFLESRKINPAQVGSDKLQALTECDDDAAMVKLVESWPPVLRGAAPPMVTGATSQNPKPAPRLIHARRA